MKLLTSIVTGTLVTMTAWAIDIQPLPNDTKASYGYNYKAVVDFTDLTNNAAAAGQVQVFPASGTNTAGLQITAAAANVTSGFRTSDGTAVKFSLGIAGATNAFLDLVTVSTNGSTNAIGRTVTTPFVVGGFYGGSGATMTNAPALLPGVILTNGAPIKCWFIASGGSTPLLSELTAGRVEVYFRVADLLRLQSTTTGLEP